MWELLGLHRNNSTRVLQMQEIGRRGRCSEVNQNAFFSKVSSSMMNPFTACESTEKCSLFLTLNYLLFSIFSEQHLLDCDRGNNGCNGGWYTTAWDYIRRANGSAKKSSYAYVARVNNVFLRSFYSTFQIAKCYCFTELSLIVK